MICEKSHSKGIQDCAARDHIQRQIPNMVHEVQGYYVDGTSKVPYKNKERSLQRISKDEVRIIVNNLDQGD
jgi:hypothetical protein